MKLLVLSGGNHPYEASTPVLESFLKQAGHEVTVTEDAAQINSENLANFEILIFNTMRSGDTTLSRAQQTAMTQFIGGGHGFVSLHISNVRPDDWHEYHDITGGGWISADSWHPPYGQFEVNVTNSNHECVEGISDFLTNDELYMGCDLKDGNDYFLHADSEEGTHKWRDKETFMPGGTFPLGWTRKYGNGKVFVTNLGHNGLSFKTPEYQKLVLNGINWVS